MIVFNIFIFEFVFFVYQRIIKDEISMNMNFSIKVIKNPSILNGAIEYVVCAFALPDESIRQTRGERTRIFFFSSTSINILLYRPNVVTKVSHFWRTYVVYLVVLSI